MNLTVDNVSYSYRNAATPAVKGASCEFEPGRLEAIMESCMISNRRNTRLVENRVRYTDEEGNLYVFLNDDLISYKASRLPSECMHMPDGSTISENECLVSLNSVLSPVIRGYEDFSITSFCEYYGGYRLEMSKSISEYTEDILAAHVNGDGSVAWFVANYSNLTEVSDRQVRAADDLLKNYIGNYSASYASYEYDVKFYKYGKTVAASYIITFEDRHGAYFCDMVSFIV